MVSMLPLPEPETVCHCDRNDFWVEFIKPKTASMCPSWDPSLGSLSCLLRGIQEYPWQSHLELFSPHSWLRSQMVGSKTHQTHAPCSLHMMLSSVMDLLQWCWQEGDQLSLPNSVSVEHHVRFEWVTAKPTKQTTGILNSCKTKSTQDSEILLLQYIFGIPVAVVRILLSPFTS